MTLTFDLLTSKSIGHILASWGSLHVKFHDDRCKGKAVMRRKPFSVIYALWPWPLTFWPQKSIGHILDSWGVCMWSFMMIGVKGKQLCAGNPNADDRRTDRQTNIRTWWFQYTPPNFVAGGITTVLLLQNCYMNKFYVLSNLSRFRFTFDINLCKSISARNDNDGITDA